MLCAMATPATASERGPQPQSRLLSLDVFRGWTIAAMILVNNPGSASVTFAPLLHAPWHGWTFTDLIFPSFLWIAGVALTLSLERRKQSGADRRILLLHALRRSAIIFGIGLFLNAFPDFELSTVRIPGVLQRIAVCYLCAAAIYLFSNVRGQMLWLTGLLAAYWVLMMYMPTPGCGAGRLEPECNFARFVDGLLLKGRMWSVTKDWDPEGVVSTLPAIGTTLLGVVAGHILRLSRAAAERAVWLFLTGNSLIFAGLVLNTWMPINKPIWTVSYALFTAGIASVLFATIYWLVDGVGLRCGTRPLVILGVNALAIYLASSMIADLMGVIPLPSPSGAMTSAHRAIYELLALIFPPALASLGYALLNVAICWLIAYWFWRRKWIFKV